MDGFTIRAARPEDHERLGDLTAAAYLDDGLLDFGAEDPYLEVLRDVGRRAEHAEVLVAVDAGGVGARRRRLRRRPRARSPTSPGTARPSSAPWPSPPPVAAAASARRSSASASTAPGPSAARRVVLSTQPTMHAAHRVYERFGFTRAPERDWSPVRDL